MRRRFTDGWILAAVVLTAMTFFPAHRAAAALPRTIDEFETGEGWSLMPADEVDLTASTDAGVHGRAIRLDFTFRKGSGWAVIHKQFDLDLPENYAFSFRIRGEAPPNHLEFKLIDSTGANVWWSVHRDMTFPDAWQFIRIKKRHISFAWGPAGGGDITKVQAIEFAITAGSGGKGTVWIDDLQITELPLPDASPPAPIPTASTAALDHPVQAVLDGDPATFWCPTSGDPAPWIALDLSAIREYGGLTLRWIENRHAPGYTILISDDGMVWRDAARIHESNGGSDYIYLPEGEARHIRVDVSLPPEGGPALAEMAVQPLAWSATREAFFQAIAADAPRGLYPRSFQGEQAYWTVVGPDADARECLLGEDGAIETGMQSFSVEPFFHDRGRLVTWNDAAITHRLEDGHLPIPSVIWTADSLRLTVTAYGVGESGSSSVIGRYRVSNIGRARRRGELILAIRPFQVNPPTQFLNHPGGTARIHDLALRERSVDVDGVPRILFEARPGRAGAVTFDQGDIVAEHLRRGDLPGVREVHDPFGAASGAMAYPFDLDPGFETVIDIVIPLHGAYSGIPEDDVRTAADQWRARCATPEIRLPASAARLHDVMRSQLGFVLVNRAGPAIQPGARSYARSWIRDGSLTSSALLRLGRPEPVRRFIEWFAPHQFSNGKIPCVVDSRGPDPVPEHDSGGEFIFLIAEYHRYTRDRSLVERMWPRVLATCGYLDSLRSLRRTDAYRTDEGRVFFGLLPESISHEGYSAKPMHSYWDDFFALRGFKDAVYLARVLGDESEAARLTRIRDEFQNDLTASIAEAMRGHGIDYVPGCADLGDFDATSTTVALSPAGAEDVVPPGALARTFDRYYDFFVERRDAVDWDVYTPYETRSIGAFIRLGQRERAHELIEFFFRGLRPAGWNQWGEVVGREERVPRFIGDMPHTWVGSDFVRSVLDCIAYPRESDASLVIGAGILPAWAEEDSGVAVSRLPTPYGPISYSMQSKRGVVEIRVEQGPEIPNGGIAVALPREWRSLEGSLNDRPATVQDGEVRIRRLPADLILRPR